MEEFEKEGGEEKNEPGGVTSTPQAKRTDGEPQTGSLHDREMKKPLLMRMALAGWWTWSCWLIG